MQERPHWQVHPAEDQEVLPPQVVEERGQGQQQEGLHRLRRLRRLSQRRRRPQRQGGRGGGGGRQAGKEANGQVQQVSRQATLMAHVYLVQNCHLFLKNLL